MNLAISNDYFHPNQIEYRQNNQRISLDKLASREMGNVACLAVVNMVPVIDDWDQIIDESDQVSFVALPAGGDKGGKDVFRVIAQVALIAAAAILSGPLGLGLAAATGLSTAIATNLVSAGIMFLGSIAINALFPASQAQEQEQLKALQPQNNIARIGQPISEVFGTMRVYPDMITAPNTRFIGNKPELLEAFHLTAGSANISDLKLGNTPIGDFTDLAVSVFNDGTGQVETRFVVPEARGIELLMPRDDGLPNQDLWAANDGYTSWFEICPPKEVLDQDGPAAFRFELSLSFPQGVGEFPITASEIGVVDEYDYYGGIEIDWRVVDDAGVPYSFSGDFEVKVPLVEAGQDSSEPYSASIVFVDPYEDVNATYLAGLQPITTRFYDKRIQVRLKRTVEKDEDSEIASSVSIVSLLGYGKPVKNVDGVLAKLTAGQMKRLPINGGTILNAIVKRDIHTFTKSGSDYVYDALKYADTPAQVVFHMLYEKLGGFDNVKKHVDLDTLWRLNILNIDLGEKFNARINKQRKFWDWLSQVCFCMRTKPVRIGSYITFVRDMKTELPTVSASPLVDIEPKYDFNPFHIVKDGLSVSYKMRSSDDVYDGIKVDFIDERVWEFNDVTIPLYGIDEPINPLIVDGTGCTNIANISLIAQQAKQSMIYRNSIVTIKTELDGLLPKYGDVIFLQHGLIDKGQTAEIDIVDGLNLTINEDLEQNFTHARIRLNGARASQKIAVTAISGSNKIILSDLPVVDDAAVNIVDFSEQSESPDTITLYNEIDSEPVLIKVNNIKPTKSGAIISGFVDDYRAYAD